MKTQAAALAIVLALASGAALARSAHLVKQWFNKGDQMCEYDNGTVLNMGGRSCPSRIEAR